VTRLRALRTSYQRVGLPRFRGHLTFAPQGAERGVQVPRTRPAYAPDFRRDAVELFRSSGRSIPRVAAARGARHRSLRNWVRHGRREGLTTDEREELGRLRGENRRLVEEQELLKRAAACFARETETRWAAPVCLRREGPLPRLPEVQGGGRVAVGVPCRAEAHAFEALGGRHQLSGADRRDPQLERGAYGSPPIHAETSPSRRRWGASG
jgi:transposase